MASEFSSYTTQELTKKLKKQQSFVTIKIIVVLLMAVLSIISTLQKGISVLTFLPLFFLPLLLIMINEAKKIKKELTSRK